MIKETPPIQPSDFPDAFRINLEDASSDMTSANKERIESIITDKDSIEFRRQTLQESLRESNSLITELHNLIEQQNFTQLSNFFSNASDRLARVMLNEQNLEGSYSTDDTVIQHALGMTLWKKPKDTLQLEDENLKHLEALMQSQEISQERLANGIYFLYVLLHKYMNTNGRVSRTLQMIVNKALNQDALEENEMENILGLNKEGVTQTGENTFRINVNPDFERLVLGVAYFGLHKGLTQDEVLKELKLNGDLPESGLSKLLEKLNSKPDAKRMSLEDLKSEFVRFMVADSDLDWCEFK